MTFGGTRMEEREVVPIRDAGTGRGWDVWSTSAIACGEGDEEVREVREREVIIEDEVLFG